MTMAEFCRQCSIEVFDEDQQDFCGMTTIEDEEKGLAAIVICEGCGLIQVNHKGECISSDCSRMGHGRGNLFIEGDW